MFVKRNNRSQGIVLVTVVIFLLIIASLSVAIIFLMSGTALLTGYKVNRIKAFYVAEGAAMINLESMRRTGGPVTSPITATLDGKTYIANSSISDVTVGAQNQYQVKQLDVDVGY